MGHLPLRFLELTGLGPRREAAVAASALGRLNRDLLGTLKEKSMSVRPLAGLRLRALRLRLARG